MIAFTFILPHQLVYLPSAVLLCLCIFSATARVAKGVECAMNENNPYLSKKASYLDKARQLVFNLKKNDQLRCGTADHAGRYYPPTHPRRNGRLVIGDRPRTRGQWSIRLGMQNISSPPRRPLGALNKDRFIGLSTAKTTRRMSMW